MFRTSMIGIVTLGVASFAVAQDTPGQQPSQPGRISVQAQTDDTADRSTTGHQRNRARDASQAREAGQARAGMNGAQAGQQPEAQKVVEHLASGNQFEIELSRLAEEKAEDQQIKQFAQQMVRDHTQAQQQLRQVAQQKNLEFKDELSKAHQAKIDELSQKEGADFDRAFSICQAGHHVEAVLMHQYLANEYQDPQIQQMARQMLPKLQQHQQHAMQVAQAQTGAPGAVQAGSRLGEMNQDNGTQGDLNRSGGMDRDDRLRQPATPGQRNQPGQRGQPGQRTPGGAGTGGAGGAGNSVDR